MEIGFIESFNGRLRDECLNEEWFTSLGDARQKLAKFREHYNQQRPHSELADQTPEVVGGLVEGPDGHLYVRMRFEQEVFRRLLSASRRCRSCS